MMHNGFAVPFKLVMVVIGFDLAIKARVKGTIVVVTENLKEGVLELRKKLMHM